MSAALVQEAAAWRLRPAEVGDVSLVIDSWLESYGKGPLGLGVPPARYYAEQRARILRLVQRASCTVACNPEDASHVLGWVVHEARHPGPAIHFVYVKHLYRRLGLGSELLQAAGVRPGCFYTHHTPAGGRFALRLQAFFHPEAAE